MKLSDIWGAKEEPEKQPQYHLAELEGVDLSGLTPDEVFRKGINAGKKSIIRELDEYFIDPNRGGECSTPEIQDILECSDDELNAIVQDDLDFFDIDRLPEIYRSFRKNTAKKWDV